MEMTEAAKLKLEKRINSFSESYMSNSKWKRVFMELLKHKSVIRKCEIFDFSNSGINLIHWKNVNGDYSKYLTQEYISNHLTTSEYPKTYYKEIEYIEFPKCWKEETKYELVRNINEMSQDTETIKTLLSKIGQFEWGEDEDTLKLIGYGNII